MDASALCSKPGVMAVYTLTVTTGSMLNAGTLDNVYVTLIGTERESERTFLSQLDDKHAKVSLEKLVQL